MGVDLQVALDELFELYRIRLADRAWLIAALFAAPLIAGAAWWSLRGRVGAAGGPSRPSGTRHSIQALVVRDLPVAVVLGSLVAAVLGALERASLVDDAFISFRFARNFAEGHGLVWNPGEPVEGYTNFLWTLLLGVLDALTPMGPSHWALVLGPVVLAANLLVTWRLGRQLARRGDAAPGLHVPLAVVVLAFHTVFTAYGTTGLETGFACLWVLLGATFLVTREDPPGAALAGAMWIGAALTRPDHGLFYAAGGLVLLFSRARAAWRARGDGAAGLWRSAGRHLAAYAAPFAVYLGYLAWKASFYGALLPNTYYAKSAYEPWWEQGALYAATFLLGHHFWVLLLCGAASLLVRPASERVRRFQLFTVVAVLVYGGYVVRVGGDFMYGRFFVSLLPLVLLGVELWVHDLVGHGVRRRRWPLEGLAIAGVMLATIPPVSLIPPRGAVFGITEEHTSYPIRSYFPLRIDHPHWRVGHFWRDHLTDRGIEPVIATGGIGMVGYHSRLELIDVRGLTDPAVAHTEVAERGRPGHEKVPPDGYLAERGVHFVRMKAEQHALHPRPYRRLARIRLGRLRDPWQIVVYDRALMQEIGERVPELTFTDFEAYLDDYIAGLDTRSPAEVAEDLAWFRSYYFDHNDDPQRLGAIETWLARHRAGRTAPVSGARSGTSPPPPAAR